MGRFMAGVMVVVCAAHAVAAQDAGRTDGWVVMGIDEKRRRNEGAREVVRTNDIARWITRQVQDIRDLVATPGLRAG